MCEYITLPVRSRRRDLLDGASIHILAGREATEVADESRKLRSITARIKVRDGLRIIRSHSHHVALRLANKTLGLSGG